MREIIKKFAEQFAYKPEIHNGYRLGKFEKHLVSGMGGSNLVAGLLTAWHPEADVISHRGYGLPVLSSAMFKDRLMIVISYSGNTEEAVDSLNAALKKKLPVAIIATGGKLLAIAEEKAIPHVKIPDASLPPRTATGLMMKAMLKVMGRDAESVELEKMAKLLKPVLFEKKGSNLARRLKDFVPVIYASSANQAVAYNWKIKLNETGKVPAFMNVFPELNHNEMNSFNASESTQSLIKPFSFIFLEDKNDNPKIQKRMQILKQMFEKRKLGVEVVPIRGRSRPQAIFSSLVLADWTAFYLAKAYGFDPAPVPMVEEFKRLIARDR